MSFSFGAPSTAAPGASGGGGGSSSIGVSFGGSTTAAPPSSSAPPAFGAAPAAPAFGSTAPSPATGFSFASSSAAPSFSGGGTGGFGNASTGGFGAFGSASTTPTPAPTAFGFGSSSAPAPSAFGGFGSAPAPTMGFGTQQQQQQQNNAVPTSTSRQVMTTSSTSYQNLPDHYKNAIDKLYEAMMQHKRTMAQVATMGPQLLVQRRDTDVAPPDVAAGSTLRAHNGRHNVITSSSSSTTKLQAQIQALLQQVQQLQSKIDEQWQAALDAKKESEKTLTQALQHLQWPLESAAIRQGVHLSLPHKKANDNDEELSLARQIQKQMQQQMSYVDQVVPMPSQLLWEHLQDAATRLDDLQVVADNLRRKHERARCSHNDIVDVTYLVEQHDRDLRYLRGMLERRHRDLQALFTWYSRVEQGSNVLDEERQEAARKERVLHDAMQRAVLSATTTTGSTPAPTTATPGGFGTAAAPSAPLLGFGSTPAPTPGFGFGTTTGFGGTTTTTPSFGAAPTLGAASTTPMAAPAFGVAPATTSSSKKKSSSSSSSRSSSRSRRY